MSIEGIQTDSWSQFVKLAQDARMRNSTLSHASQVAAASRTGKSGAAAAVQRKALPAAGSLSPLRSASFLTGQPEMRKQIIGSLFDAYA